MFSLFSPLGSFTVEPRGPLGRLLSAVTPIADKRRRGRNAREVPKADKYTALETDVYPGLPRPWRHAILTRRSDWVWGRADVEFSAMRQAMPDQTVAFASGVQLDIMTKIIVSCTLTIALSFSTTARAETIFLKCGNIDVLSIDLTRHTVDNRPANITAAAIDWRTKQQVTGGSEPSESHWHIDRVAGTFTLSNTVFLSDGRTLSIPPTTGSCVKTGKPATKF